MHRRTVCVICGGQSAEHEISLLSTCNVLAAIDRSVYDVVVLGIAREGSLYLYDTDRFVVGEADDARTIALADNGAPVAVSCRGGIGFLTPLVHDMDPIAIDVAFPVLHGPFGEDGAVQGLLRMLNVPYVGCDHASSAICMDKDVCKRLLADHGVPGARSVTVLNGHASDALLAEAVRELGLPLFVKPARLGSSFGVSRVETAAALRQAVDTAFRFDHKILLEEAVEGRELECAVLGNADPRASGLGQVVPAERHGFYSREAKYYDEHGAELIIPAPVSAEDAARVREIAVKAFRAAGCEGMARVDVFLQPDGDILVNEINTIPGFTDISMYPKLWEQSGLPCRGLVSRLIDLAFERAARDEVLATDDEIPTE